MGERPSQEPEKQTLPEPLHGREFEYGLSVIARLVNGHGSRDLPAAEAVDFDHLIEDGTLEGSNVVGRKVNLFNEGSSGSVLETYLALYNESAGSAESFRHYAHPLASFMLTLWPQEHRQHIGEVCDCET